MFTDGDNVFGEFFRSSTASSASVSLPAFCAMLTLIPLLIVMSTGPKAVLAAHDLTVHRMQHYDFHGIPYGSRSSVMNLEMRTLTSLSQSFAKKCLLLRLWELIKSPDSYKSVIKEPTVGGILIIIPNSFSSLSNKARTSLLNLENSLVSQAIDIPIYFAKESQQLLDVYRELAKGSGESDGQVNSFWMAKFFNAVLANGYQLSITGPAAKPINDPIITNIEAKLSGNAIDDQSPTIIIAAHYDAFGTAPGLAFGADSNGSGVVALLELARLFSKLYSYHKSHPSVNLVFLLAGAGKFSYLGTKKWIEEHLENRDTGLLADAQLSICLDSIGSSVRSRNGESNGLYVHVSRPPKENSPASRFFKHLTEISSSRGVNVTLVPEKTYLSDDPLSWEHERFILGRLPGLTVSSLSSPKNLMRTSIADTSESVNVEVLSQNIELVAEALSRLVFKLRNHSTDSIIFKEELGVSRTFVNSILQQLSSQPRGQQMLLTTTTGSTYKVPPLLSTLQAILKKFSKDTRYHHFKLDRKEPEIVFYEPTTLNINIYNIKPAIFDLFLSIAIILYLAVLYLFSTNFHHIQAMVKVLKNRGGGDGGRQNGSLVNSKGKQQ